MAQRSLRTRIVEVAAVLGAASLAVTSCGGSAGGEEEAVFVQAVGTLPHLNPQFFVSPAVRLVGGSMMEPLVKITNDYDVVPWLAQDWELSDDGLEMTLHLQEDVQWHDGEPFTSEDVKFNLEEVIEFQYIAGKAAASIDSVEAPDEHTVVVHFNEPYGPFLQVLALQFMVPKHIYEGTDFLTHDANSAPVGTGPMVFDSFAEEEHVEVVKNENYWAGDVSIDRMIFPVFTDTTARDLALLSGELDRSDVDSSQLPEVEADPALGVNTNGTMPWHVFFNMNAQVEELSDPKVRQLVYSAIDRERIHEAAVPNNSDLAESIYPDAVDWAHSPNVNYLEDFPYDVDAINEGLDEAGYPVQSNGCRFDLELTYMATLADARSISEVIQSSMDEVGICVDLNGIETRLYMEQVYEEGNFDITVLVGTTETDPSLGITIWHECNEERVMSRNPSGICDEEIDALAEQAIRSVDQEARGQALQQLEERAAEVMISAPIVHLWGLAAFNDAKWEGADLPARVVPINWHEISPTSSPDSAP
ncbi:ABC transporter substrate-binding protein [Nesterenkonia flava]|uniref:ABC transporter substrate-binding protein n=1 Tax=Nesterenkonia flava TaxID=469799 RepID=A0ABU1FPK3_9MICC|nr:ABC transporter substrate-binding protein [Nesterenkonia flava]MDR5710574.1 ABC transporter substrate-binding protein [Nesterenkonia flava]